MMELFQESAEIDLTVKLRQNKNVISYYLGKKEDYSQKNLNLVICLQLAMMKSICLL